ncbi:hypothetical protein AGMMS49975_20410 [Clostridia bacterium]|nr:hypothetical protein AGMMS49975_20410 [Clostridia bacterium]
MFKRLKLGQWQSVGVFGEDVYAFECLIGRLNSALFWEITKEEFDTAEEWWEITDKNKDDIEKVLAYKLVRTESKKKAEIMKRPQLQVKYALPKCIPYID